MTSERVRLLAAMLANGAGRSGSGKNTRFGGGGDEDGSWVAAVRAEESAAR